MFDLLAASYFWIKAFHIVSVISWMAGLLYLPRLFVYHSQKAVGSEASEMLKVMEYKLYRLIMRPAMMASLLFGALLLITPGVIDWSSFWIYIKLASLVGMFAFHGLMGGWLRDFQNDSNSKDHVFFRYMNEGPTLLMVLIVIMVVVKPF